MEKTELTKWLDLSNLLNMTYTSNFQINRQKNTIFKFIKRKKYPKKCNYLAPNNKIGMIQWCCTVYGIAKLISNVSHIKNEH